MKRRILVLLVGCLAFARVQASFDVECESGLATFDMQSLKGMNVMLLTSLPFHAKTVSNFEPYYYVKPSIMMRSEAWNVGFAMGFQSTGSRISSWDHTAEYLFDVRVKSSTMGVFVGYKLFESKYIQLDTRWEYGAILSNFHMQEQFVATNYEASNDEMDALGINMYAEPSLRLYGGVKPFAVFLNVGYQVQMDSEPLFVDTPDYPLSFNSNYLYAGWSGFRVALGVSLRF